jgi:hypothetical protein
MPRGRKPEGDRPLSDAERQARHRTRCCAQQPHIAIRIRKPVDRRSRPSRWRDAVAELLVLQAEYAAWLATMPNSLQESVTAEALQAIVDLDLDTLASVDPPRGYGRD